VKRSRHLGQLAATHEQNVLRSCQCTYSVKVRQTL